MSDRTTKQLHNEKKKLEDQIAALRAEKDKLQDEISLDSYLLKVLLDNIPDAIYFKNKKSQFLRVSAHMVKRFGYAKAEELIGKTDFDFFSIQHAQQAYDDEQNLINTGKNLIDIEEEETWPDKRKTWVSTTKMCIRNNKDEIIGTFGISRDITLRKIVENALKASEAKYKELYDYAPVGYHEINLKGNIIRVNKTEAKLLGYKVREIIGQPMLDFLIPRQREKAQQEIIDRITTSESLRSTEWKYVCKNGKQIDVSLTYKPCYDDNEQPIGALITMQDITDRKKAQEKLKKTARELKKTTKKLKRSNAELEQFAYIASHDLQEPLRMVSSYLQLLSRRYQGKLDSNADDFIAFAVDGAKRMQGLINDLLIYSRVDTKGRNFECVAGHEILNIVETNLKIAIEESRAVIRYQSLPVINVDAGQMIQLFQNLIGNAIKFKGDVPPEIDISAEEHEGRWLFSIKDNGIGIDPAYVDRIFMIFQRLHTKEEYPGTGIGLSVCKKIVERHNGNIWVEPVSGRGTIFHFTIPDKELKKKYNASIARRK